MLNDGIKNLCNAMLNGDSCDRNQFGELTNLVYQGIEPHSRDLRTSWLAPLSKAILVWGSDETDQIASKISTRDNPYVSLMQVTARRPNTMPKLAVRYRNLVFGVDILASNIDIFHVFQLLNMKLEETFDKVSDTIMELLLVVRYIDSVVCIT